MDESAFQRLVERVWYQWVPELLRVMLPVLTGQERLQGDSTLLAYLGNKQFWREVYLLPFIPLAVFIAILAMFSMAPIAEYMSCEEI